MVTLYEHVFNWDAYLGFGSRQFFKRKQCIYAQGTIGDGFYFLHQGLVRIVSTNAAGKERMLNIVIPNQLLGVQSMDKKQHFTTAIAVTDSIVYHFPCDKFKELIKAHPELLKLFSRTVIHKMRILLDRINLDTLTSEQKIAFLLYNVCYEFKNFEVPINQHDIASCTGLTRITVYKVLKQWQENGIVEIMNKKYFIKKPDFLRNLVK
ncbi:Crp/Fnr family transcriptional regulator [Neobacillus fumarioli]|uniref:Crp/Fnr family transcriptional regulator n=1 Tax=Neobacillus fumarioli TaxID=105229 RepID=UPI000832FD0F|nr:Crp/Fnr family transcriptional regulator [Neobacillus fumarioli]